MKYATFVTDVKDEKNLKLPMDVCEKLRIEPGDRVEVTVKKIKSGRLDLILSENPLYRLLDLSRVDPDIVREEK